MYKTTKCRRADSLTNKVKSAVMLLMLFVSFGSYAQYCEVSATYDSDHLSSISTTNALQNVTYSVNSHPDGSYDDETDQIIMQAQGLSFDISTTYVGGVNGVNVWIDFDGNEEFDDEEKVFSLANSDATKTGTITIPSVVAIGEYRMRVRGQYGSTANPEPCGNISWGTTVDFTLSVTEAPDCMPPSGLTATPTSLTTVELSWEEGDGIGYDLEWGEAGFDQGDGTLIEDLTNTSTEVTVVTDTEYEFYVRQDCGPDGYSMWVGPFSFETGYCDPVYQYGCSNGAKISNFEITNSILNLTNNTGTASCGTNGYNDFTSMSASAPAEFEVSYSVTVGSYSGGVKLWVDWNNNGEFEADELMGQSTSTITSGNSLTGNFIVPAGTPLGDYRIRARVVEGTTTFDPCSQHNYGETEDYTFTVIEAPDCMPPTGIAATPTSLTAVELSWNEGDGIGYEVEWGEAGFDQGDGTLIEDLTVTSTEVAVVTDTEYQFYVRQDCGADGYSLWAGPYNFQTGYCDPVYQFGCSNGSKISNFEITNAILNLTNNTGTASCGTNGYNDFTSMSASAPADFEVSYSVTVGSYSAGVKLWIDWNNNGEFEADELMGESASTITSGNSLTGNFTVPTGTPLGDYRIRARVVEGTTTFDPCSQHNYGETEDYTFTVIEAPDCMPPTGIAATPTSLTAVELSWNEGDGIGYEVEWGEAGFDQGDGTLIEDLTDTSTEVDVVTDTEYEFYVRQDCGPDGYSLWAGPYSFETGYCTPTYSYGCSSGAKISNVTTSDAILNIANETGSSSCGANGYNDFTSMSASSPAEAVVGITVGVGSYSGGVKVWIDWNNNGEFETDELMAESASTITSGSSFTGSFTVPAGTSLGDYRMRVRVVEGSTSFDPCSNYNYGETEDYTFTVIEEPDCMPPTGLGIESATYTSANLSWVSSGDLFDIEWGEAGFEQGEGTVVEGVTENPYTLEGLEAETGYEFYVRQDCGDDGVSLWAGPYYFYTGYCQGSSTYTGNRINGFATTAGYTNISNMDNGTANDYNNYTNLSVTQSEGGSFDYSVSVPSYTNVEIWIDFNNNLTFDTDELVAEHTYASSATIFTGTIDIPENIDEGDYRIRVRSRYYYNTAASPCNDLSYGETEDYTLTIVPEPDCLPPTELAATALSLTSMELSWVSDGNSFEVEWGEAGFDQGDGTIVTDIDETTYNLDNLTPDTEYEFYVRQDCGADGESLWAGPYLFFTGYCEVSTSNTGDYISAFSTTDALTNVTYSASSQPTGSYSNQTSQVITQSAGLSFDFSTTYVGGSNGVNIWIDYNNNLEFEESEKVFSLANSNATKTGTITIPADTPIGQYRVRVRSQYGSTANPAPCGNVSYGSTIDFTLNVVAPPDCMPPAEVNIVQVTDDSLQVGWTAPAEQDAWQVLVLPAGSPAPDEDTTGWIATTENPFTVEGLDPATEYDAYVRADCSDDGVSLWAGPASATTTQIAADVDFEDDFEGSSGWTFTNGTQTNQWHVGTATSYQGGSALYISNDSGNTNAYTTSSAATVTHAIRDLAFPDNTNEATISFWWKARGEGTTYVYDYMRVWLMPSTFQPTSGTLITDVEGGIQLGDNFNNQEEWEQFFELLDLSQFAGQTGRLIFEWRNDGVGGTQPPAAVDNVEVKLVTCSRPIEVTVEKNQVTGNLLATWTPVAGETQWEVIVQAADEPAPDETTTGEIVNQPQYLIEDVVEGEFYKIYVRAICDEDDKSLWTEGVDFSDFNPPACANIDMDFPDLTIDEQGDFIFCAADGQLTLDLVADFDDSMFKSTTSYEVEQIDYAPPFPFLGGIEMPITADDDYTASFELPFNFCFFGNEYSYCRIGDNGVVTFGLPYTTTYGEYCPWTLNGPIPSPTFSIKNAIYGVFQDMLTTNNPGPDSQINYQVLGTYPCRALVVNFNEVPAFGGSCSGEQYRTTTQIVLYEITNIIEIYVANRTACSGWQSGLGVLGIQNEDGTVAYTPPGRNTGAWDAVEEAWRFTPNGETTVDFGWYVNGEFYSDNPVDQIIVTEDTCIEARVSYPGCGGDDLVLSKQYCVKVAPEITLDKPEDIKVCLIDGEYEPINLTDKIPEAIDTLSQIENFDLADYDISFYLNQSAADAKNNPIPNPESYVPTSLPQTVWVRVEHESTGCYGLTSFDIYQGVGLDLNRPDNVVLCVYFDIIPETDLSRVNEQLLANINDTDGLIVNYYHSQQDAIYGSNPIQNWANFEAPSLSYEIWIKVSGSEEICESITSFMLLEGIGLPEYEHPDFDICTGYVLPMLPDGYFYTTEYLAEGEHIQPGTVIKTPGVHTIYVNIISDEGCITSSSYNVNIIECAVPRGISPNGDGLNDNFDLSDYFLVDLKIFNRDGREVYSHGMGYTNEWEGQSNSGNLLPDGTYYYRIVTPVEELTGWVQLVRETR